MTHAAIDLPGPIDSVSAEMEAQYIPTGSSSSSSSAPTVTANVSVNAQDTKVDLRSEPYMERSKLMSYIATGQTEGEMASGSAYGLAMGAALGAVGGAAGRSLGFQVVNVTQDAYGSQVLSAGNYVDPRLYLGFRQPVVESQTQSSRTSGTTYSTEFEVEVEAMDRLLLKVQGGGSQYRFLLRPRLKR
jgi:autotransporter translocation and assembly factor TamB